MDIRKVKKLIEMLEESGVSEIEIHEGEESVRISRNGPGAALNAESYYIPPVAAVANPSIPVNSNPTSDANTAAGAKTEPVIDGKQITAPMVGTFYRSSAPGKSPFVEVGTKVAKGDVICIIEAMKMLNQIEAETSGIIKSILIENGQPIEFDQALFLIKED